MRTLTSMALAALTLAALPAAADTGVIITHQGFLIDANDKPVDEPNQTISFKLFSNSAAQDNETVLWSSGDCTVKIVKGYYSVLLGAGSGVKGGCGDALQGSTLPAGSGHYLEVSVASAVLSPRLRLSDVPAATN